jgi:hypothetical protein
VNVFREADYSITRRKILQQLKLVNSYNMYENSGDDSYIIRSGIMTSLWEKIGLSLHLFNEKK